MPRPVLHQEHFKIPENIKCTVKSGVVTIEHQDPKDKKTSKLVKDLSHLKLDFEYDENDHQIVARCWFGNRKLLARIGTLFGIVKNMITGVTLGWRYKMHFVYSHFPIKHTCSEDGRTFDFNGFMGHKEHKIVTAPEGVRIWSNESVAKDEINIEGANLEDVSLVCGQIHQLTKIKDKDLRKFLDGIYVQHIEHLKEE
ncbi:ribosomal protein L6, putative [Trichomonas vaginalis G3]|uniref:Ribosomal protein L6, putative n=1 Tax=Trichomonas vaginalis (strain ATCC PRA-98 / G3) TaxID=412133 RepID=A2GN76_TRIV3|nr:rRNA binding [Trichomonas vaginalis G3]EAX81392.1 ribosomal protein L6, putative [Trichomonas vaginalis G3]KAI5552336.1 rRNA binding [Trichomonas vaginalis G3]|eukprot:XP_001294322.1 ribosomal protein L6 [Trichomonas vaginalis G3]